MEKVEGWRQLLNEHIEANRERPFEWGQHDCGLWVASALVVTTGVDIGHHFRGRYTTAAGALKAIRRSGVKEGGPEGVAAARLGPAKPIVFARAGDVVAADLVALGIAGEDRQIGLSLGICTGAFSFFVGEDGLVPLNTLAMKLAFDG